MTSNESITTAIGHRDDVTLLIVDGVVDLATAPALEAAIDETFESSLRALVIDLTKVTFLASVGLRLLISASDRCGESTPFGVVASGPATSRVIQLTNLADVFALYSTVEEAVLGVRTDMAEQS
jgi:anti-anti-sigma factor